MKSLALPQKFLENLSDCLAVLDRNGRILYGNRTFRALDHLPHDLLEHVFRQGLQRLSRPLGKFSKEPVSLELPGLIPGKKLNARIYNVENRRDAGAFALVLIAASDDQEPEKALAHELTRLFIKEQGVCSETLDPEFNSLLGEHFTFKTALVQAQKAAKTDLPVLLVGESGTGKEILARIIHKISNREKGPFVDINCAAIPESLIESELFGYERGAFTGARQAGKEGLFAEADHGTLFLDEIGDTSLSVQSKLLRVLQEGAFKRVGGTKNISVNVRIISATNKELESIVHEKRFRDDLYFRLNTISISLPALRDRGSDIKLLADYFLRQHSERRGEPLCLSQEAMKVIDSYHWPGNIRELRGVMDYAATMSPVAEIGLESLPPSLFFEKSPSMDERKVSEQFFSGIAHRQFLPKVVQNVEKFLIETAVRASSTKSQAIKSLGISRRTFYNKVRLYDIDISKKPI